MQICNVFPASCSLHSLYHYRGRSVTQLLARNIFTELHSYIASNRPQLSCISTTPKHKLIVNSHCDSSNEDVLNKKVSRHLDRYENKFVRWFDL